ncbi:MAG TPA: hypothetical protein VMV29_03745, partial [Ktedonobacterales bacterium]|nr:hypothetical protein [Ktedonobacterales bacterium]
ATLAQARENIVADCLAALGLGRVLLRRGLWEEAASAHTEAAPRLRATEEVAAQGLAQLGLGEARRNLDDTDGARQAFAAAQRLYHESGDALSEAAALQSEARTLMAAPELEAAVGRYAQAQRLVERVGDALADAVTRAGFYDAQAMLYAEAIYTLASEQSADGALTVARAYAGRAGKAGRAAASQRLREYDHALPRQGASLAADEATRNKAIARILADARKALK